MNGYETPLTREKWYESRATAMIAALPERARQTLAELRKLTPDSDAAGAALIGYLTLHYAHGRSPDRLAEHLSTTFWRGRDATTSMLLGSVVIPVIDGFRAKMLPLGEFWNPESYFDEQFEYYILKQLRLGRSVGDLEIELASHWGWVSPHGSQLVKSLLPAVQPPDLHPPVSTQNPRLRQALETLMASDQVQTAVQERLALCHPRIMNRPYLQDVIRFMVQVEHARRVQNDDCFGDELQRVLADAFTRYKQAVLGLFAAEGELIRAQDPQRLCLTSFINRLPNVVHYDPLGPNALPDSIEGETRIPGWLRQYVFEGGGRIFRTSMGPIAEWVVVADSWNGDPPDRVGFLELQRRNGFLLIPVQLEDSHGAVGFEFCYALDAPASLYDLLLTCLTGRVRLDLFDLQASGEFRQISSRSLELHDELIVEIQNLVDHQIQELFEYDPERFGKQLLAEMAGSISAGFHVNEQAKSERLLMELTDLLEDSAASPHAKLLQEHAAARSELLEFYAERAAWQSETDDPEPPELRVEVQRREGEIVRLRENIRGTIGLLESPEVLLQDYSRVVACLGSSDRCFIHLCIRSAGVLGGIPEAFWMRPVDGQVQFGRVDFPDLDLSAAEDLTRDWVGADSLDRQHLLEEVTILLGAIATPLAEALAPIGVKHLILSPTRFLELLPIHCAAVHSARNDALLCDVFDQVSYAPSLRILDRLSSLGPVPLGQIVAATYADANSPLPGAVCEVKLIESVFPGLETLVGRQATPAQVLKLAANRSAMHLSCHGRHFTHDFYYSGVQLYGTHPGAGWLSIARILGGAPFVSLGLAVLAACESGRSVTMPDTIQAYGGVDGAFLAGGSRSTISALWEINDLASLLFMATFYTVLNRTQSVAEAYQRAVRFLRFRGYMNPGSEPEAEAALNHVDPGWRGQCSMLEHTHGLDFSHPFFWGSFKASGLIWNTFAKENS